MLKVRRMDKQKVIDAFDSVSELARILGCTPSAIFQWPDELPRRLQDRVIAAAVRKGIDPAPFLDDAMTKPEAA